MYCWECGQFMNHDESVGIGYGDAICAECAVGRTDLYEPEFRIKRHLRGDG